MIVSAFVAALALVSSTPETLFTGRLEPRLAPIHIESDGRDLVVRTLSSQLVVDGHTPGPFLPGLFGKVVLVTGISGGKGEVIAVRQDSQGPSVERIRLPDDPVSGAVAVDLQNFAVVTRDGYVNWINLAAHRMARRAILSPVSNLSELRRGLCLTGLSGGAVAVSAPSGELAIVSRDGQVKRFSEVGSLVPPAVAILEAAWAISTDGRLWRLSESGPVEAHGGVGSAMSGLTPVGANNLAWGTLDGRVAVFEPGSGQARVSERVGSSILAPLLLVDLTDSGELSLAAATTSGDLVLLDPASLVVRARRALPNRASERMSVWQEHADVAPRLAVSAGLYTGASLDFERIPAAMIFADWAVTTAGVWIEDGVSTQGGVVVATPAQEEDAVVAVSCSNTGLSPGSLWSLLLLVVVFRAKRHR